MDYNARWYGPYLNHFVSADTIVPGAGNPQGLNRYGYVYNNPLRFTDPSGHYLCEDPNECDIFDDPEILIRSNLWNYGITAAGLDDSTLEVIVEAGSIFGLGLSDVMGGTSEDAFLTVINGVTIIIDPTSDITDGICETDGHRITCKEPPKASTLVHEFGHVFDYVYRELTRGDNLASDFLGPLSVDEVNLRYNTEKGIRSNKGYLCSYEKGCQASPVDSLSEELADTLMNLFYDGTGLNPKHGFALDSFGDARRVDAAYYLARFLREMGFIP